MHDVFDAAGSKAHPILEAVERGVPFGLERSLGAFSSTPINLTAVARKKERKGSSAAIEIDDAPRVFESRAHELEDAPHDFDVDLKERTGRDAVTHAVEHLFDVGAPNERPVAAAHDRVLTAQLVGVGKPDRSGENAHQRIGGARDFGSELLRGQRHDRFSARARVTRDDVSRDLERFVDLGRGSRAIEARDRVAQLRRHDRARVDWHDIVGALLVKTDGRRSAAMLHDQRHLVAIGARMGHADRVAHDGIVKAADALECAADRVGLPGELGRVAQVLKLAPAAGAEHTAERRRAVGRRRENPDELTDCVLRFDCRDADARTLLR